MGLDIVAASRLEFAGPLPRGRALHALAEEFEARGEELYETYFVVSGNRPAHRARLRGTRVGLYTYGRGSRTFGFRAGSYTTYNWWRNELCLFAHGAAAEDVWAERHKYRRAAFYELIDFTDSDGRIGTAVCAELAADFAAHARRARPFALTVDVADAPDAGAYWLETYRNFARAFELAANGGALRFC